MTNLERMVLKTVIKISDNTKVNIITFNMVFREFELSNRKYMDSIKNRIINNIIEKEAD